MDFLNKIELFSRTGENSFVFNLFDLLLCGVIVLVSLRGWRGLPRAISRRSQLFLLLAFCSLGGAFAVSAAFAGGFLFFRTRLPQVPFDLLSHTLQALGWLLLAASVSQRPTSRHGKTGASRSRSSLACLLAAPLLLRLTGEPSQLLHGAAVTVLDLANLCLLGVVLVLSYRRPMDGKNLATVALAFIFMAGLLHLGVRVARDPGHSVVLWNLEQFLTTLSLFVFALAIGETSRELFDKVFVRLQIAFILLASVMILVVVQTEKTEYLASIRGRSEQLGEFVRAHVDYFRERQESLPALITQEDFLQRVTLGFGNLPELKIVRIFADGQVATFEIAENGGIRHRVETLSSPRVRTELDPDEYFLMNTLPLRRAGAGQVEFYGVREFLDRHVRKRILLIFSLFTGMVILSTLMIGMVVGGASATIRQQARAIEATQRQLMQASKMAAIGELAAGVAHEINNPATTILTRASFLLSEDSPNLSRSSGEDLKAIVTQGQRIAQITRGLLMFSRPQSLEIEAVPIDRVLETSLREVEQPITVQHISVIKNVEPHLLRVLADEDSLARALENLFRNAVDAMPQGGTLEIRAARDGPSGAQLRLEISDSGVGIEPGNLARIFDPFFTTKEVGKGTGLGLSIVHRIIKEHQGTIAVESRPGAGTKFVIILPMEP